MVERTVRRVAGTLAVLVVLAACAQDGGDAPSASGTSTAAVDHPEGAQVFQRACASCHGPLLDGGRRGPPLTDPVYDDLTLDDLATAIERGVPQREWDFGPMPPRFGLSDDDVAAIWAFVEARRAEVRQGAPDGDAS